METEKCIIVFLDVLGYKSKIMGISNEEENQFLITILDVIKKSINLVQRLSPKDSDDLKNKIKVNLFSDNIVISMPMKTLLPNDIIVFIEILVEIQRMFIFEYNLYLRGGMDIGSFYCDERFVFGSGLVNAYTMESQAKNPRILISEKIYNLFNGDIIDNYYKKIQNDILKKEDNLIKCTNDIETINNMIMSLISLIGFTHYKALDKSVIPTIVSLHSIQLRINENIACNSLEENYILKIQNELSDVIDKYCEMQKKSFIEYRNKFIVSEKEECFINYLEFYVSPLFYCNNVKEFPVFIKNEQESFIYTIGIDKDNTAVFCNVGDGFLINRESNVEMFRKIGESILQNIKGNEECKKVLSKYMWSKEFYNKQCKKLLNLKFINDDEFEKMVIWL